MKINEKWMREHLPEDCRNDPLDWFPGLFLDGLKVMTPGERGVPEMVQYWAKDEEDFPDEYFQGKVKAHLHLLNYWFLSPHWGYDVEKLCFVEISHSRELSNVSDKTPEINDHNIIRVVD